MSNKVVEPTLVIRAPKVDPMDRAETILIAIPANKRRATDRRWVQFAGWLVVAIDLLLLVRVMMLIAG